MLYLAIAFFLTITPLAVYRAIGDGIRTPKEIISVFGLIIISGLAFFYDRKPIKNKWLWLFVGWCFLTITINNFPVALFTPKFTVNLPSNLLAWKEMFYITLVSITLISLASIDVISKQRIIKLGRVNFNLKPITVKSAIKDFSFVITSVCLFLSIYAILQIFGMDDFFRSTNNEQLVAIKPITQAFSTAHRTVATLGNPTILCFFLATCIPFFLFLRNKFGYATFGLVCIVQLVNKSATSIAIASIAIFIYLLLNKSRFIKPIIILLVLTSIVGIYKRDLFKEFINPTGRIEVHKVAWEYLQQKPLTGLGLGTFEYVIGLNPNVINELKNEKWRELHNEYGQLWWSTGLIGLALFLMMIVCTIRLCIRNFTREAVPLIASLAAFLIGCLTLFPMRVAPSSFYAVVEFGLLLNLVRGE